MPEDFEVRAVIDHPCAIVVRPADPGQVWLRVVGGLDSDSEVAVDPVVLSNAMAWVIEQNPRGEE